MQETTDQAAIMLAWATEDLDDDGVHSVAKLSGFKLGMFGGKRKAYVRRELGFLNLFIMHSVAEKHGIPDNIVNVVFNAFHQVAFPSEVNRVWFTDLNDRIKNFGQAGASPRAGGVLGITGAFLLQLHSLDKAISGFSNQAALAKRIGSRTEQLLDAVESF